MRDWRKYVRQRLAEASEHDPVDERVVQELAEHLEDVYTELRASGLTQAQALRRTSRQVGDWLELRRGIQAVREGEMQERLKQFWLPSLVTLLLSWGCLAILIWAGVQPYMSRPANDPERLLIYWPWLVMLPFVGALGAYMARRAQSNRWKIYTAGAFPVVATAVVFLLLCPWAYMSGKKFIAVGADMLNWVLLPGIALLIGVAVEGLLSRSTRVGHA